MSKRFSRTDGREAVVAVIPSCDFCKQEGKTTEAVYDAKSKMGPWGYMCEPHFQKHAYGLGEGRGQKLFTEDIE
jgi:hypothetical protein